MATRKLSAGRATEKVPPAVRAIPHTRSHFNLLLASNPNYFSNLEGSPFTGVVKQKGDTTYEQVECVGLNPQLDILEAVLRVKQSIGYSGGICAQGSLEYVRFYADYANSNTWTDLGTSTVRVHDIPGPKPICYNAKISINPPRKFCTASNTIRVRAILSWNSEPPPNSPAFTPAWGNVLDVHVQIRPTTRKPWGDVLVDLQQAKLSKELTAQLSSFDTNASLTVNSTPHSLGDLRALYRDSRIPVHRFAFAELHKAIASPTLMASMTAGESPLSDLLPSKKDIEAIIKALQQPANDTSFEQVTCVGLRSEDDTVSAIVSIKRPNGYLGGLCRPGSVEYVAFWLETAPNVWDYLGTSGVRVHDLNVIPPGGVEYAVYLPVDLSKYFRKCTDGAVVKRLRAVLQWNVPPSNVDPNAIPHWGNRSECRVQLRPGDPEQALKPSLLDISNIPADGAGINQASGLTVASNAPFGGTVAIRAIMGGFPATARQYKIEVRKHAGPGPWQTLNNAIQVRFFQFDGIGNVIDCSASPGFQVECVKDLPALADWYDYINTDSGGVKTVLVDNTIGYWHTTIADEGLWDIKATFRNSIFDPGTETQVVTVRIDNTAPSVHAAFDVATLPSGQCGKFNPGAVITGTYQAHDPGSNPLVPDPTLPEFQHFYALSAILIPGGLIPHDVSLDGFGSTRVLGSTGGNGTFSLNTGGGTPCGYVIRFVASDRTIYGYLSGAAFNWTTLSNEYDVGFCLG